MIRPNINSLRAETVVAHRYTSLPPFRVTHLLATLESRSEIQRDAHMAQLVQDSVYEDGFAED